MMKKMLFILLAIISATNIIAQPRQTFVELIFDNEFGVIRDSIAGVAFNSKVYKSKQFSLEIYNRDSVSFVLECDDSLDVEIRIEPLTPTGKANKLPDTLLPLVISKTPAEGIYAMFTSYMTGLMPSMTTAKLIIKPKYRATGCIETLVYPQPKSRMRIWLVKKTNL